MLFSAFTGSRPDVLLGDDNSPSKNSQESSIDDSSESTLADNSDGDTLVDDAPESNAQNIKNPKCTPLTVARVKNNGILCAPPDPLAPHDTVHKAPMGST